MSDKPSNRQRVHRFLRKGEGKLASDYQDDTSFADNRAKRVVEEQLNIERNPYYIDQPIKYKYRC